jgi:tetratricopeptide (TPR) repeat protein
MDLDERISRFEALVGEEPDNDMAVFSLAGAYNQAGRYADAARTYARAIEINPDLSKAYQLAGTALMADQDEDAAAEILDRGYRVAAERGDLMPQRAMGELLEKLGREVPEVESKAKATAPAVPPGESLVCHSSGKSGTKMPKAPFRGPLGAWIHEHIANETFQTWIGQGTKVINELRLDLSRDEDADLYDYAMRAYLRVSDELYRELTGNEPARVTDEQAELVARMIYGGAEIAEFKGNLRDLINERSGGGASG